MQPEGCGPSEFSHRTRSPPIEHSNLDGRPVSKDTSDMTRLLVLYGHPKDPAAFDKYYQEAHLPIAKQMKGLKKWTIGKVQGMPGNEQAPYYYVADLYMESREEFERLLSSPEGQAAVADVPKYATGGVTFIYTEIHEVI